MSEVELGFLEAHEDERFLLNIHFPSKVGGRPAWLDLVNVPSPEDLKCENCLGQLTFLLQVYASLQRAESFHRTIFVFVCTKEACKRENGSGFRVFRNQIRRQNEFYGFDPVPEDAQVDEVLPKFKLCAVCGCRGPFKCARCKSVSYCSKEHQKIDWTSHKSRCETEKSTEEKSVNPHVLFPEFELVLEQEVQIKQPDSINLQKQLEELKSFDGNEKAPLQNVTEEELSQFTVEEDRFFSKFRKRIAREPEQVLRYDRKAEPLWISGNHRLSEENVPKCQNCNGDRVFEFQIMPQLLNSLKSEHLDWGILAVYTCEDSCGDDGKYLSEFIHQQDISTVA